MSKNMKIIKKQKNKYMFTYQGNISSKHKDNDNHIVKIMNDLYRILAAIRKIYIFPFIFFYLVLKEMGNYRR